MPRCIPRLDRATNTDRPGTGRPRSMILGLSGAGLVALTLSGMSSLPTGRQELLLVAGVALVLIAFPRAPRLEVRSVPPFVARGRRRIAGLALAALGFALAGIAAWNGYSRFDSLFDGGFWQFAAGGVLAASGLAVISIRVQRAPVARARATLSKSAPELVCVTAVLLAGFVCRVYRITSYPPAFGWPIVDEPQIGLAAVNIVKHGGHAWQYPELVYSGIVSLRLFGASMAALRYPGALISCMCLVAFYLFVRLYFRWPVALAGTALLAVSHWDLAYSRIVVPATWMMVYELFIILLAAYAVRGRGSYPAYFAMGVLTGIGAYSHASFRLVPILLVLFAIGWLLSQRRTMVRSVRSHAPGWLLYAITALIVALPYVGIARADTHMAFSERFTSIMPILFDRNSLTDPGAMLRANLQSLVNFFSGSGDGWAAVDPHGTPMLDIWTGTLFLLGFCFALLHCRQPRYAMWVTWLVLTLVTGGLLTSDFAPERFLGALPVVFVLACVPLQVGYDVVVARRDWTRWCAAGGLVAVICAAGASNLHTYFAVLPDSTDFQNVYNTESSDVVSYFRAHGHGGYGYLIGDMAFPAQGSDYGWLANEPQGRNAADLADLLPIHDAITQQSVNILVANSYRPDAITRAVRLVYPQGREQQWSHAGIRRSYAAVTIAAADVTASQGLAGPCPRPAPCAAQPGASARPDPMSHAFWTGSVYIPVAGRYTLRLPRATNPASRLSIEGRDAKRGLDLARGWYSLSIELVGPSASSPPTIDWTGPGASGVVPANFLYRGAAHGMTLQFLSALGVGTALVAPARCPFPEFLFTLAHDDGRPLAEGSQQPFRAVLSGIVAAGHAGTYRVAIDSYGGDATVFLDGRGAGATVHTVPHNSTTQPPDESIFELTLNGRAQNLQIQYDSGTAMGEISGVDLVRILPDGTRTFFPWEWFSPMPGTALAAWIG